MTTVNRNGGLGGFWPKPQRPDGASNGAKPESGGAKRAGDTANFSNATGRLAELAGDLSEAVKAATPSAAALIRESKDLGDLIDKTLARNLGRKVNLGKHRDALVRFVQSGLAAQGLSFDDLKNKRS
ncbi:MAG: hypothetical protein FJZ01_19585 [Candidatus Sericytochromatia bacterium]|nr:hypothetical protein [Candidatus Tanganyikabacteria bacterium]